MRLLPNTFVAYDLSMNISFAVFDILFWPTKHQSLHFWVDQAGGIRDKGYIEYSRMGIEYSLCVLKCAIVSFHPQSTNELRNQMVWVRFALCLSMTGSVMTATFATRPRKRSVAISINSTIFTFVLSVSNAMRKVVRYSKYENFLMPSARSIFDIRHPSIILMESILCFLDNPLVVSLRSWIETSSSIGFNTDQWKWDEDGENEDEENEEEREKITRTSSQDQSATN